MYINIYKYIHYITRVSVCMTICMCVFVCAFVRECVCMYITIMHTRTYICAYKSRTIEVI